MFSQETLNFVFKMGGNNFIFAENWNHSNALEAKNTSFSLPLICLMSRNKNYNFNILFMNLKTPPCLYKNSRYSLPTLNSSNKTINQPKNRHWKYDSTSAEKHTQKKTELSSRARKCFMFSVHVSEMFEVFLYLYTDIPTTVLQTVLL